MNTRARIAIKISSMMCMVVLVSALGYGQTGGSNATCSFRSLLELGPSGINDAGAIVGGIFGRHVIETSAFLIYHDQVTLFRFPPGSMNSWATDINKHSQIVGGYDGHGFVVRNGAFQAIDFPGASSTSPNGINSSGAIVGSYGDRTDRSHAFLLYGGRFTSFSFPGAKATGASRMNDHGVIVGWYGDDSHGHGFQVKNGVFATVDFPGGTDTGLSGVDNAGNIVGNYSLNGVGHGFVLTNGKFITIDAPDAKGLNAGTVITGVNNLKQIVGYFTSGDDPTVIVFSPYQADCQ